MSGDTKVVRGPRSLCGPAKKLLGEAFLKLLWLDLETTGLYPSKGTILEVGVIVTQGAALSEVARLEMTAFHPLSTIIPMMDKWCTDTHSNSGLLELVQTSSKTLSEVEMALVEFIKVNFPDPKDRPVLAGNSVHFDRSWLAVHMPEVDKLLHYRHFDVSALKMGFSLMLNKKLSKKPDAAHRSIADLENAIAELKELFDGIRY